MGGPSDLNSHRSSSSHVSHTSTPANVWPTPTTIGNKHIYIMYIIIYIILILKLHFDI